MNYPKLNKNLNLAPPRKTIEGKFWGVKKPPKIDEQVTQFILGSGMTSEDFIKYFQENIKPEIDKIRDEQEQQRYEQRQKTKAQQKKRNLPENKLPNLFLLRKKKPEKLKEALKNYTLNDLFKTRRICIENKLTTILGASQPEFLSWLNTKISQRVQEGEPTKTTKNKLRELLFRGR